MCENVSNPLLSLATLKITITIVLAEKSVIYHDLTPKIRVILTHSTTPLRLILESFLRVKPSLTTKISLDI